MRTRNLVQNRNPIRKLHAHKLQADKNLQNTSNISPSFKPFELDMQYYIPNYLQNYKSHPFKQLSDSNKDYATD